MHMLTNKKNNHPFNLLYMNTSLYYRSETSLATSKKYLVRHASNGIHKPHLKKMVCDCVLSNTSYSHTRMVGILKKIWG